MDKTQHSYYSPYTQTNCNLVIIDFAVRHGYLKPDEPLYSDICSGLHG